MIAIILNYKKIEKNTTGLRKRKKFQYSKFLKIMSGFIKKKCYVFSSLPAKYKNINGELCIFREIVVCQEMYIQPC